MIFVRTFTPHALSVRRDSHKIIDVGGVALRDVPHLLAGRAPDRIAHACEPTFFVGLRAGGLQHHAACCGCVAFSDY